MSRHARIAAAAAVCIVGAGPASAELLPTELLPLEGHDTAQATALNDHWVVGHSGPERIPVRWNRDGIEEELALPDDVTGCTPTAINWRNEIVGQCRDGIGILWRRNGKIRRLRPLGDDIGSMVWAIDARGNAVGWSQCNPSGESCDEMERISGLRAVVWLKRGRKVRPLAGLDIPAPHDEERMVASSALGVDSREGRIVGYSGDQPTTWRIKERHRARAARFPDGNHFGQLEDINSAGVAVGTVRDYPGEDGQATLWQSRSAPEALAPASTYPATEAHGINAKGQILGEAGDFETAFPVMWQSPASEPFELPPLPGDDYAIARDINDRGEVAGSSCNATGCHPIVWRQGTPTS